MSTSSKKSERAKKEGEFADVGVARKHFKSVRRGAANYRMNSDDQGTRESYLDQQAIETTHRCHHGNDLHWSRHLAVLLCGTRDDRSSLSLLRGHESTLLKQIYKLLVDHWKENIKLTHPASKIGRMRDVERDINEASEDSSLDFTIVREQRVPITNVLVSRIQWTRTRGQPFEIGSRIADRPEIAFARCGKIEFPPPADRNVNMMPFTMGDIESLPEDLKPYYHTIITQCPVSDEEIGKVCFLTVAEGFVHAGQTQRRPGLHTESPGSSWMSSSFTAGWEHSWGVGHAYGGDEYEGGLFMASTLNDTCEVWNALVDPAAGLADSHGGVEHLRPYIGAGTKLRANELVWLTDRTPHEALPQQKDGYRQFFRLVTSQVSLWFAANSTANPKVSLPDFIQVIPEDKFSTP